MCHVNPWEFLIYQKVHGLNLVQTFRLSVTFICSRWSFQYVSDKPHSQIEQDFCGIWCAAKFENWQWTAFLKQWIQKVRWKYEFRTSKITPLWPYTNAETEEFNRTLTKNGQSCFGNRPKLKWTDRSTSNYTYVSPATALFGRNLRTRLPELSSEQADYAQMIRQDVLAKEKMKLYADSKQYVKPSHIQVDDPVVIRKRSQRRNTIWTSSFNSGVKESLCGHCKEGRTTNHKKQFILQTFSMICDFNSMTQRRRPWKKMMLERRLCIPVHLP